MSLTCETRRAGGAAGPENAVCLVANSTDFVRKNALPEAEIRRTLAAIIEACCELICEFIFENLGAARLFIKAAQLLIEGHDDVGARHSALHVKGAVQCANELAALKAGGGQ